MAKKPASRKAKDDAPAKSESERSGGIDAHGDMSVHGDVAGRDVIQGDKIQAGNIGSGAAVAQGRDARAYSTTINLPSAPVKFILQRPPRAAHFTRRDEALKQLLIDLRPGRVVTLTGPGGIGKSALAAEATIWSLAPGDDPPRNFPDGIWWHTFYNQGQMVEPLALDDAVVLLRAWAATREICALTGGLPLALRLAGSYMMQQEQDASEYLAWLRETPLLALDHGARQRKSVRVLLERSVERLSEEARNALAVVGLLALAPFGSEVVAAALEVTDAEAKQVLGEGINRGLLLRRAGRYEIGHALIHRYAHEQVSVSKAALERLAAYYTTFAKEQSALGLESYSRLDGERTHIMQVRAFTKSGR